MKRFREEHIVDVLINSDDTIIASDQVSEFNSVSSDESVESNLKKQTVNNSRGESSYYILGCNYLDGIDGVEKDYLKAFELFTKGAEEGCLESMHKIGYCYVEGLGVEKDYSKAMEWFLKSAEGGFAKSQFNIGQLYELGNGVEQDDVKAFEWFSKAAENGDLDAHLNIGVFYHNGRGLERNYVKAYESYLKVAENGYPCAQCYIGILYQQGNGVEQDDVKAFEWFLKAAENGDTYAQYTVGLSFNNGTGIEQDYTKAFEWYLKAAENGDPEAQYTVACFYVEGLGVEKDMKKSVYWHAKRLNEINFKFIEPYHEFEIEAFTNSDDSNDDSKENEIESLEQVIIRLSEKDFKVSNNLSNSKYLTTMLNSNWRDLNEKHEGQIILDLRSIENSIFEDETNYIQIFELYFNYLTRNELPITDCELKLKLIELSRYLGDDECILQIMRESTILLRFYILFKFELIEPIHIAIASCFATESSASSPLNIEELSENVLEVLLTQTELSELSKKEICDAFEKKFNNSPRSTIISTNNKKVIHLKFTPDCPQNEINFNNTDIIFTLKEDQDNIIECDTKVGIFKIGSS